MKNRMTNQQAAEYLGISARTLNDWRWSKKHRIPHYRIGRAVYYRLDDLENWIEAQRREG